MPAIGDFIYGGYFAGWMDTTKGNIIAADASQTGKRYMLIVAPKSLESAALAFKTTDTAAPAASRTRWDGLTATAAMNSTTYPAAHYCAGLGHPADGGSAWYLPAMDELELIYRNLKPTAEANWTTATAASAFPGAGFVPGVNPSSDPQGAAYTSGSPGKTSVTAFQEGQAQALGAATGTAAIYATATESDVTLAWVQVLSGSSSGFQGQGGKSNSNRVRPVRRVANVAPNAPIPTTPPSGGAVDLGVTNRFGWIVSDSDVGDSQSKFDLRYRLVGAPSWTTVTQATPNAFWDAPAGTFTAGDYEWQVRTYDAQGLVGPYCTSAFFTAAVTPPTPTITAPVNGATVAVTDTLTWSTPDQDSYQVRRVADNAGTADPSTVYSDTGEVADGVTRTLTVAFPTNNRYEWIQVRIRDGGLWSQWASVRVQVSWTPPADPTGVKTSVPSAGAIDLTITNPAPSGGEPTVSYNDVYYAEPGEAEERKATLVPPNSTWRHWLPASDAVYTYRIVAVATNGTTSETVVS